ncbi:regulatory protein RecX [Neobittarella massiliensis]|uniref:Regulatory protein RecX n=2 Tax=Oscillospiraceae TaxID=216572 RepID=A0A8J6INI1_9FIRM|nr:regulatory protein RecX [Neobittarella massiliensis]MBC3516989.1 regulatory protein RecX [Neobittarella massiliensis]SCJ89242.1 Regulatory protein recX [uncultured Anaerotruncus sp.]
MRETGAGVVTGLEKTKRGRYSVFVDGEFLWSIDGETLVKNPDIRPGKTVSYAYLEEVKYQSDIQKCKDKALDYLGRRPYAQKELTDKLSRTYPRDIARQVAELVGSAGLLDDLDYGYKLAAELFSQKHYSVRFIGMELQKRGLTREQVEQILADSGFDDGESIRYLLARSYSRDLSSPKGRDRALAALARRGFSYSDCRQMIAAQQSGEDDYEEY